MSPVPTPQVINLDDEIGYEGEKERPTKTVQLLGEEFRVQVGINAFASFKIAEGDGESIMHSLVEFLHPSDRERFMARLRTTTHLEGGLDSAEAIDRLIKIFRAVGEVAAGGRPTKPSSGSSRSTVTRVATKRSAATSSRRAATRKR